MSYKFYDTQSQVRHSNKHKVVLYQVDITVSNSWQLFPLAERPKRSQTQILMIDSRYTWC